MTKKEFAGALRKTAAAQKSVIDDRFAKADSVLLKMKADSPQAGDSPPETAASGVAAITPSLETAAVVPPKGEPPVVRDTFSMPSSDHGLIEILRTKAAREGRIANKSEIVRAGLQGLAALDTAHLLILIDGLERIKPGRK